MKKKILAIILARQGSKRLPNKNHKIFHGKPLIVYTFEALKKSKLFDRIILSTDSKKLRNIALKHKIEVPFLRPKKISKDNSLAIDAIKHSLDYIKNMSEEKYDYVQYVMPTTPLKKSIDFINAYNLFRKKKADMVISVSKVSKPKEWMNPLKKDLKMTKWAKKMNVNSQKFETNFIINGCIYLAKWDIFYKKKNWYKQKTYAFEMPKSRSIDIDDIEDFNLAKAYFKVNQK